MSSKVKDIEITELKRKLAKMIDTIVGSNNIKNSRAVFTLVERKTRFQITIKYENKKALTIYKTVKKIKKIL